MKEYTVELLVKIEAESPDEAQRIAIKAVRSCRQKGLIKNYVVGEINGHDVEWYDGDGRCRHDYIQQPNSALPYAVCHLCGDVKQP